MFCNFPFKVKVDDHIYEVPCGRCLGCRVEYTRQWASRIVHEMDYYNDRSFICLTYDDEHLPPNGVEKDDLQKFIKRLRKNTKKNLKYFACGEYGGQTKRPHYHVALLGIGISPKDKKEVEKAWPFGHVNFGTLTYASARYVAGYILKKYEQDDPDIPENFNKMFVLFSKGLGKRFVYDNFDRLAENKGFTVNGIKHQLPRYYRNILGIGYQDEQLLSKIKEKENYDKRGEDYDRLNVIKQQIRDQKEKELRAKTNIYKRDKKV